MVQKRRITKRERLMGGIGGGLGAFLTSIFINYFNYAQTEISQVYFWMLVGSTFFFVLVFAYFVSGILIKEDDEEKDLEYRKDLKNAINGIFIWFFVVLLTHLSSIQLEYFANAIGGLATISAVMLYKRKESNNSKNVLSALMLFIAICTVAFPIHLEITKNNTNEVDYTNSIGMEFVLVPAGEFMMGSNEDINYYNEVPIHEVTIEQAYYLGRYEVTQKEWMEVMGSNPSRFYGDRNPVEQVSWDDVQEFTKRLNEIEGTDKYRLPSEAEWEYACRAGTTTKYYFGDSKLNLIRHAWYSLNSRSKTHPVGQKKANSWGLYDMYGNVWEWCQDDYHGTYEGAPSNGTAWEDDSATHRITRGGGWLGYSGYCYSAQRSGASPDSRGDELGFRLLIEV